MHNTIKQTESMEKKIKSLDSVKKWQTGVRDGTCSHMFRPVMAFVPVEVSSGEAQDE